MAAGRHMRRACSRAGAVGLVAVLCAGVAAAVELPAVHGFVDVRGGGRTQKDGVERQTSLAEARLQLDLFRMGHYATVQIRSDVVYDDVAAEHDIDLEQGRGAVDLREANVLLTPATFMDVKLGRQILTWGTGDLVFINDLFPKDWQSFFVGRDEEYLKAPSDAAFVSLFPGFVNIDVAYTPRFDADRYIRGERLSFWNPALGRRSGRDAIVAVDKPDAWFEDDEAAVRVSRTLKGYELALYGYHGFWKSPQGMDPASGRATFPRLAAGGASLRGIAGSGVLSLEGGYYASRDDRDGADPMVPNGEVRFLAGYEREVVRDLTASVQYYLEHMDDYDAYRANLPDGMAPRDEDRHLVTLRVTQRLLNQNLTLSLFAYYSPSDDDGYLRPAARYKLTDAWLLTAGGNLFFGEDPHTFFGQFEDNSNLYAGARYSF
jgi:hypothetical protein